MREAWDRHPPYPNPNQREMGFADELLITSPGNKREMGTPDSRNLMSVISCSFDICK